MQSAEDKEDFENFLSKVSSIDEIVKGLSSDDTNKQKQALNKADIELEKLNKNKTFDKTFINKEAYSNENLANFSTQHTSQEDFLGALEADSRRRTAARKERHEKANLLKYQGNQEYKKNKFSEAIQLYTEGTKIAKDLTPLYTNRAACYLKLGQCEEAISDCDFSLKIDEKWSKAFVFKGRAYQKMHKFDEAIAQFKELLNIDDKNSKLVQKYIKEVEEDRRIYNLEVEAEKHKDEAKQDPVNIEQVIQTLRDRIDAEKKVGSDVSGSLMYYAGGLRVLQAKLVDGKSRTMFRMHGGFKLFSDDGCVSTCLKSRLNPTSSTVCHGSELVSSVVCLLTAACQNEAENLRTMLALPSMPDILLSFPNWPDDQVKRDVITLFHESSLEASTREIMINAMNCARFGCLLLSPKTLKADANTAAAATLCNFSLEQKFLKAVANDFEDEMLPAFTEHLNDVGTADYEALTLRMRCIVQLTEHQTICSVVAHSNKVMENISAALERCVKSIKSGLSNPCAMEETLQLTAKIIRLKRISPFCESLALLLHSVVIKSKETGLLTKCLSVMSLCMEGSVERTKAVYDAHGNGLVKQLYKLMKHSDFAVVTYSLKIMCFIGQSFHAAIEYYTTLDKDYTVLRHLLMNSNSEGTSYVNQSHAAMLFGVIAQLPNGLEPILRVNKHGDLVRHLLVLCRDSNSKHCKANCAITLGKMAQGNTRFLEELRKHDGINILARNKPPEELLE